MPFKYVYIPADPTQPMTEIEWTQPVTLEDDSFINGLKEYFGRVASESSVDVKLLLEQIEAQGKLQPGELKTRLEEGDEVLKAALSSTSVDIFTVCVPTKATGFVGVSLYCDDKGKAKGLMENERASKLALACGYVGQNVNGDVFLSRIFDDGEDEWYRMDIGLSDVSSDADWVKRSASLQKNKSQSYSLSGLASQLGANTDGVAPQLQEGIQSVEAIEKEKQEEGKKFRWRQTGDDVEVTFDLPVGSTKKDLKVDIKKNSLKVLLKGDALLDSPLFDAVIPDESTWTLSGMTLQVTLCKKASSTNWTQVEA